MTDVKISRQGAEIENNDHDAIVVGAGIGGLVAATELAASGFQVRVFDRAAGGGGKLRTASVDGQAIDCGPTVFTLKDIFEEIFSNAGETLSDHLELAPLNLLARHAWPDGSTLDLFADQAQSQDAIGDFAGAKDARGFARFCRDAESIYHTLNHTYLTASRPNAISLSHRVGFLHLNRLLAIRPFTNLWRAIANYFSDPRLRQLFGRYATYCGSSPYQAPATLMLIAHVEQRGVWRIKGGMKELAKALQNLGEKNGASYQFNVDVDKLLLKGGKIHGITLNTGETINAPLVVSNVDNNAMSSGMLGQAVKKAAPPFSKGKRSLSAVTWSLLATTKGLPLAHHTVCFSDNYEQEFSELFKHSSVPKIPTVYLSAQDRHDDQLLIPQQRSERIFSLINAPAVADEYRFTDDDIDICKRRLLHSLARCNIELTPQSQQQVISTPNSFDDSFPGSGGAIYGRATHGWAAAFQRPGCDTNIKGLYLAGGCVHPGAGLPMVALSGKLAAATAKKNHLKSRQH